MKILWLASWYPDFYEPTNGDFIQRHAIAVSKIIPVDLIHVVQVGKNISTKEDYVYSKKGNLQEFIYSFAFRKWGWSWLDKIRYNIYFISYYRTVLNKYSRQYGKPDLIHVHVPMKAGMLAIEFSHRWKIPFIVSEHSSMYDRVAADNFLKRSYFFRTNTKKIFKNAAAVTNVSAAIGKKVQDIFGLKQTEVVHNVVATTRFYYQPNNERNVFRWLHVSSLYQLKNVEGIIEAFKSLNQVRQDWELIIVGNASQKLIDQVFETGLSNKIKFVGELQHRDVAKQMMDASALVLFSRHENFPCVIIEALCCGVPVVSSNVGGVSEAVNDSNGLLVESENIEALKNAFIFMIDNYHLYDLQQISMDASKKYSEEVIGGQFVSLYRQVIANFSSNNK
ncbi:glycogen synthase [mine drainage metagenome]|uniref:Glycogen synthase n=1 Tax=mine drainage metagenome TaxID=410659 RepID=A0A1J5SG64_9ZZZZ